MLTILALPLTKVEGFRQLKSDPILNSDVFANCLSEYGFPKVLIHFQLKILILLSAKLAEDSSVSTVIP